MDYLNSCVLSVVRSGKKVLEKHPVATRNVGLLFLWRRPFLRNLRACSAGFGQSNRYGLLAALNCFAGTTAFELAALHLVHRAFDFAVTTVSFGGHDGSLDFHDGRDDAMGGTRRSIGQTREQTSELADRSTFE
jgi:hypothetical protein